MSRVLALWRGSFASTCPARTASPSSTWRRARTGIVYSFEPPVAMGSSDRMTRAGVRLRSRVSVITFSRKPVCSSLSSRKVVPSITSWKRTTPSTSLTITELYGSQEAITAPFSTACPSATITSAP
jgi:hypothetical protein